MKLGLVEHVSELIRRAQHDEQVEWRRAKYEQVVNDLLSQLGAPASAVDEWEHVMSWYRQRNAFAHPLAVRSWSSPDDVDAYALEVQSSTEYEPVLGAAMLMVSAVKNLSW